MFYKFELTEKRVFTTPVIEANSLEEAIKIAVDEGEFNEDLDCIETLGVNYTECEYEEDAEMDEWEDEDIKDKYLKVIYG